MTKGFGFSGGSFAFVLFLVDLLLCACALCAEKTRSVRLDCQYYFSSTGLTGELKFVTLVPVSIPGRQVVKSKSFSPRPARFFSDGQEQYAEFLLKNITRRTRISVSVLMDLFPYDGSVLRPEVKHGEGNLEIFLKSERFIESDNALLRETALKLKETDQSRTVRRIFSHVLDRLSWEGFNPVDRGALCTFRQKSGDCTDYADLFTALCRSAGVPARFVEGFWLREDQRGRILKHNWAEVWLAQTGWIPLDPSFSDRGLAGFNYLPARYITLSRKRTDAALKGSHFAYYSCTGDALRVREELSWKEE